MKTGDDFERAPRPADVEEWHVVTGEPLKSATVRCAACTQYLTVTIGIDALDQPCPHCGQCPAHIYEIDLLSDRTIYTYETPK